MAGTATEVIADRPPLLWRRPDELLDGRDCVPLPDDPPVRAREPPELPEPLEREPPLEGRLRDPLAPPLRDALADERRDVAAVPRFEDPDEPLLDVPDERALAEREAPVVPVLPLLLARPRDPEAARVERLPPLDELDDERLLPLPDERLPLEARSDEPRSAETDISFLLVSSKATEKAVQPGRGRDWRATRAECVCTSLDECWRESCAVPAGRDGHR